MFIFCKFDLLCMSSKFSEKFPSAFCKSVVVGAFKDKPFLKPARAVGIPGF